MSLFKKVHSNPYFLRIIVMLVFGIFVVLPFWGQSIDTTLHYPVKSIQRDPYTTEQSSGVDLNNPKNFEQVTEYDPETGNYIIRNMVGDVEVGSPTLMSYEEYKKYDMERSLQAFWKNKRLEESGRGEGGPLDINISLGKASAIFGEGGIKLRPQGYAELQFGVKTNKIDNPALSEDLRKTTIFDFDEKIVLSVAGSVGDRIKMNMDYNTEATFDFDNTINLNYEGKEDDIVKKVEAGNVSLPLGGSLIRGSQSLFGVKTELQFGKLSVAAVFSQQESETETMTLKGGATSSEFEIRADEYDANRHFFLTHFFEQNYDNWMQNIPVVMSGLVINRIEVWVTNKRGDYDDSRNIVGFMDLAEPNEEDIYNNKWESSTNGVSPARIAPDNRFNTLYNALGTTYRGFRNISNISSTLSPDMQGGVDYEKVENARRLSSNEYTLNRNLGYISLNTSLNSDEVLAVAFEYQYRGQVYVVGEFSTNDSIRSPQALAVKLLKGTNLSPELKTWDLMMKNIYSLNARQVDREDFRFEVMYRSDSLGTNINYIPEDGLRDERLLNLMKLDRLNSQNEKGSDGFFDWVPGLTVIPDRGKIIFPVAKPFSTEYLTKAFGSVSLAEKYAYDSLYTQTITVAEQNAEQNKFVLEGSYKAASGSEIKLNAFNIPRGSVKVTAGGRTLTENVDYTVDYASGYLKVLNQSILESGTPIQVSMENTATFSLQKKTMLGTHLEYRFNDDFNLGGTIMHLYERPLTQKVSFGEDPISNTIWGLNGSYKADLPLLTKLIDKLPLIETKAPSSVTLNGEVAQLIPGHANVIGNDGSVYLDDFEATKIGIDIKHYFSWKLSSTPSTVINDIGSINSNLDFGKERAKIAWYTIDRLFQQDKSNLMPSHIKNDADMRSNHYTRAVSENNLFPNKDNAYGESTLIPTLNVAYYPKEKGPYNFSTDLNPATGKMLTPKDNWGGIMRRMETTDFEQANIEYIEFWLLDPFIEGDSPNKTGGKLVFNLGDVSEDILKDGRKAFEHGLPIGPEKTDVDTTAWGIVPVKQSLTQAFANTEASRQYQDVGLDGLNNDEERVYFINYYNQLLSLFTGSRTSYIDSLLTDIAQDDYHYYRGTDYDEAKTSILARYKQYNNVDGNSPINSESTEAYSTTGSNLPDAEDINQDNTLSENENYYRYEVDLKPGNMRIGGQKFITDVKTEHVKLANGEEDSVKWYQFRIPVSEYEDRIGSISGLKSIRFMRMFLTDFSEPVILRFASLELVRGEWRKYSLPLDDIGENNYRPSGQMDVGSVNIEENSDRTPVNYVLPPGVDRVIDPGQPQLRELNEQSMSLKVLNLDPQDSRAVYKTLAMDMRQFKRLQMWVHAEELPLNTDEAISTDLEDNDLSIFIRVGSDFKNNYYEYEIPLKLTPPRRYNNDNADHREMVWPLENKFDIPFSLLTDFKLKRNRESRSSGSEVRISQRRGEPVPDNPTHWVYIKGNPTLSEVRTIMIGVRNKRRQSSEVRSGEIWVNEMRLSEFDEKGGWAGIGSISVKLADLGTVNMSGSFSTAGFGGLEQNLSERQIDDFSSYDISTNLQLGKFFPQKAQVSLPVNYSYSKDVVSPQYNPLDEDVKLQDAIDNAETQTEKDSIKSIALDVTTRKSISLPNVRVGYGGEKKQFFDPNNVSMNFTYNEIERQSPTVEKDLSKTFRGGIQYNYSPAAEPFEPFRSVKFLSSDHLALIRDFNLYYLPSQLSFRTDMNRNYNEMLYRDVSNTGIELPLSVSKDWYWNRQFNIKYKLSNSLQLSLSSQSNALIGEPDYMGQDSVTVSLNRRTQRAYYEAWQDSVMRSIREWGRSVMYHQVFSANYTVPFSKVPLLNWVSADATYNATYDWQRGPNSLNPNADRSLFLGHTIENSRNVNGNVTLNFSGLYSKWKFLEEANRKYGRAGRNRSGGSKKMITKRYEDNISLSEGQTVAINHKLGSTSPNVRVYDADNRQVTGRRNIVDDNTLEFTPGKTVESARVVITARVEEKENLALEIAQRAARVLMGIKSVSANYTRNNSLIIPGFDGEPNLIGQDNIGGMDAPGYAFAFGSQSLDIIDKANRNGWLIDNQLMTDPYISQQTEQFRGQASLEPINGLRITLNTSWAQNEVTGANYFYDENNRFIPNANETRTGNFSMSWISIRTAFEKIEDTEPYTYAPFEKFVSTNRNIIAQRINKSDLNSQDVLIPAFLAAYSGIDANTIKMHKDGKPDIFSQLPNWTIRYDGLSKIPFLQKYFRNVTLNHGYTASYNIGGYNTNLSSGRLEIPSVNITEALNPLINVDMAFRSSLTGSVEMSKMRNIMLNISNNQVVETVSNDFSVGVGYRWDNFNLVINSGGRSRNVSNDLNLRADFTLRDMKTIIRKIEEDYNQPSTGQNALTMKFTADYTLSRSVTIRLFYDRQAINPLVSTSFSTATSNFGVSFKFQLIQ